MRLRKLKIKDAKFMLEWMHDPSVVKYLQTDFLAKTIEDCINFISSSQDTTQNIHLAIVDDKDEYMGTVSLKNITKDAEFAITIRNIAMGKGYSKFGMKEIIRIGLQELNLTSVYWCVSPVNVRAVRFYDKNGYKKIDIKGKSVMGYTQEQMDNYLWYEVRKNELDIK